MVRDNSSSPPPQKKKKKHGPMTYKSNLFLGILYDEMCTVMKSAEDSRIFLNYGMCKVLKAAQDSRFLK
jgi:hypothetical protein